MREIEVANVSRNMQRISLCATGAVILERQGITDVIPDNLDLILVNLSAGISLVSAYLSRERFVRESTLKFGSKIDEMFDQDPEYYGALVSGMVSFINTALNLTYIITTIN